ncbi:nicolin-1 [Hyperolius riggenbachi]|uniref:nicolin-1 n=1 Tax=Hyperolius riggenbachi TaxID=752182 RepID=UPI0035A26843
MAQEAAPCTIRTPVPLQVGDGKSELGRPGVYVIDVTFPHNQAINIQEITFKNYYTAFLTVRIQQRTPAIPRSPRAKTKKEVVEKKKTWRTCLRNLQLMANPHVEEGSQDYVSLYKHQMLCPTDNVTAVRLILRQPSPVWTTFTVEELQINPPSNQTPQKGFSWWLNHLPSKEQLQKLNKSLPDRERVSSELQQMWVLTEVMRSNQSTASVGRFDVDGCYDINLLSYT